MQFKHPEILWALLLLLIPIIIHLFQLRRFQKVAFTNVKFLKNVKLQTRKSSQLKKWLTLLTRLLLITCLVFAFAQPFTSKSDSFNTKNETVIYLDNSFSMQANGSNGSLLNQAIQDAIKGLAEDEEVTIFTNDKFYKNTSIKAISNDFIALQHSPNQLSYQSAYLKGKSYFSKDKSATKNLILLSDFQQKETILSFETDSTVILKLVQPRAQLTNNISIDSVFISNNTPENLELTVNLSQQAKTADNISVSLFNSDELVAKTAVAISKEASTTFTIPNNTAFDGTISIDDTSLKYDNTLFFNMNTAEKIKVLSINETSDVFLKKLYTNDEFDYSSYDTKDLNYSEIEAQNLIILNELQTIPNALINTLKIFKNDGGSVLIITSNDSDLESYNQLLSQIDLPKLNTLNKTEKRVTSINYDHPIIADAFYNRVSNFQYPKVNSYYSLNSKRSSIFSYEDNTPFLVAAGKSYLFTSALNETNGNFKKSPLIVPVLYNIGKQSNALPKLYYTVGRTNTIDINTQLGQDAILSLVQGQSSVIPLQQAFSKKVTITADNYPSIAGILEVKNDTKTLKKLSFNYSRDESNLTYYKLDINANYTINTSLLLAIDDIKSNASINALWKWFVIFALGFLLIEMLLLKYFK
jgi:hypothetical protein